MKYFWILTVLVPYEWNYKTFLRHSSGSLYYKEYRKRLGSRGTLLFFLSFLFWLWFIVYALKFYLFLLLIQGQKERDQCYNPILEELDALFPDRNKERYIYFWFHVAILFCSFMIFLLQLVFQLIFCFSAKYDVLSQPSCLFSSWCWTWTIGFRDLTSWYAYNQCVIKSFFLVNYVHYWLFWTGFVSQGNEFSYYMMICSSFILNQ